MIAGQTRPIRALDYDSSFEEISNPLFFLDRTIDKRQRAY